MRSRRHHGALFVGIESAKDLTRIGSWTSIVELAVSPGISSSSSSDGRGKHVPGRCGVTAGRRAARRPRGRPGAVAVVLLLLLLLLLLPELLLPHGHRLRLPRHPDHRVCLHPRRLLGLRLCLSLRLGLRVRRRRLPRPGHVVPDVGEYVPDCLRPQLALLERGVDVVQAGLGRAELLLLTDKLLPRGAANLIRNPSKCKEFPAPHPLFSN